MLNKMTTEERKSRAKSLYDLLDGLVGMIVEQGWDGLERYYPNLWNAFIENMLTLKTLDAKLGNKFHKECIAYGVLGEDK